MLPPCKCESVEIMDQSDMENTSDDASYLWNNLQ